MEIIPRHPGLEEALTQHETFGQDHSIVRDHLALSLPGGGIVGATAAMVGLVSLPGIGSYLRTHAMVAFRGVFLVGTGLLMLLLARTRLRGWLTQWRTLYRMEEA